MLNPGLASEIDEKRTLEAKLTQEKLRQNSISKKTFRELVFDYSQEFEGGLNKTALARYLSSISNRSLSCVREWIKGEGTPNKEAITRLKTLVFLKKESRLKELHDTFAKNLVSVRQLPDLENCIYQLGFRSYEAMVRAICEATNLGYGQVFRIKYNQKRVRVEIKHCLDDWMKKLRKGGNPEINPKYLVVSSDEFRAKMYKTKKLLRKPVSQISRSLASEVGFSRSAIFHYFAYRINNNVPRVVYDALIEMMNNSPNQKALSNPSA